MAGAPHRRYYPLLVVTEGFPVSPFTLPLVRDRARGKDLLTGPDVAQLEIVDLVELEMLEGLAEHGGSSIVEILRAKRHGNLADSSVRDFILLELQLQPVRPARLDSLWTSIFDIIADTLGVPRHQMDVE